MESCYAFVAFVSLLVYFSDECVECVRGVVALLWRARQQIARRQRAFANWVRLARSFRRLRRRQRLFAALGQHLQLTMFISMGLRPRRAPPPGLEAMPSLVDRALLKLLDRSMSLQDPLEAELQMMLGQMAREELQTFVDPEEALETSARVEFDDFATVVEAAGAQTPAAIARNLKAVTRISEAGLRNVADAITVGSAQTAAAPLRIMMPCGDTGRGSRASTELADPKMGGPCMDVGECHGGACSNQG